jgi:hypothetical protein
MFSRLEKLGFSWNEKEQEYLLEKKGVCFFCVKDQGTEHEMYALEIGEKTGENSVDIFMETVVFRVEEVELLVNRYLNNQVLVYLDSRDRVAREVASNLFCIEKEIDNSLQIKKVFVGNDDEYVFIEGEFDGEDFEWNMKKDLLISQMSGDRVLMGKHNFDMIEMEDGMCGINRYFEKYGKLYKGYLFNEWLKEFFAVN